MAQTYDIERILDEVVTLPSLPGTVAQIMQLVEDPSSPLSLVAKVISADPPLAIKTLRLVNTAYYGLRQKVSSIDHAVVLLGTKVIKNLAFTATVFDIMKDGMDSFFRHSAACGVAMKTIALSDPAALPLESPDEAFVYGLLHDIGKVLFEKYMPEQMRQVRRAVLAQGIPSHEAEVQIIGVDHAEMGASMGLKWKLPDSLVGAIRGHHDTSRCTDKEHTRLAAAIAVADLVCVHCGMPSDVGHAVVPETVWQISGLTSKKMSRIMELFFTELPSVEELIRANE